MLSSQEESWVLDRAYLPEHVVPLMEGLSGGEACLLEGFLIFLGKGWMIFVGFPLEGSYDAVEVERVLQEAHRRFSPIRVWFLGPQLPEFLEKSCQDRESDQYFRLELGANGQGQWSPPGRLRQVVARARERFSVECHGSFGPAHRELTARFLQRARPGPRVRELYLGVDCCLSRDKSAVLLSAWDAQNRLAGYGLLELGARHFSVYVAGCAVRESWASHASDLLMAEMVRLSLQEAKQYMHLGLGVNPGISRFKRKWGGLAWMPYEVCGWSRALSATERFLRALGGLS
jgi:hypothetical protein